MWRLHKFHKFHNLSRIRFAQFPSISIQFPTHFIPNESTYSRNSNFSVGSFGVPGPPSPPDPKNPKNLITKYYKEFKLFMKKYGWVGLGTYWCIWSGTFASFYCAFESGLVDYHTWQFLHLDLVESYYIKYMGMLGIDTCLHPINSKTESLLIAFMAAKITKPIQWGLVFGLTPIISQKLGYVPPPEVTVIDKIKNKINKL